MSQTSIVITNGTTETATLYLTLGATTGSVKDVSKIPFVTNPIAKKPLQGYFTLAAGESTAPYAPTAGEGINGNISLDSPPINCPTTDFPIAVNLAEFILNNGYQAGNPQETLDISGVAGTNAQYEYSMTGGGVWNASAQYPNVTSFENKTIGNNVGQIGVYPYSCDVCTGSSAPPTCASKPTGAPSPPVPQTSGICNVQRDAKTKAGGTVTITLKERY